MLSAISSTVRALCVVCFCASQAVNGQDVPYLGNQYIYDAGQMAVQQNFFDGMNDSLVKDVTTSPATAPQSMSFIPNQSQRKRNIAAYVSSVAKIAPDYAPKLAAEFGDGAVFAQYAQVMDSVGLDANDVGDHLAVWWITAWEASVARPVEIPPAAYVKVKAQVARLLSEKALTAMTNAEKQRYADSLAIQTMVLANQIEQAKNNPNLAQQLAAGIKAGAKKIGFDLGGMTLTENGFLSTKDRKTSAAQFRGHQFREFRTTIPGNSGDIA
jgi:hypothetical protein